jgi:hypothetical protein
MNTMLTASNLMKGDLGHDLGTKVNNTRHLCTQVKDGTMTSTTSENKGHDEQTFIQALRRSFVLVRPWCLAYRTLRPVGGRTARLYGLWYSEMEHRQFTIFL